ncbi:2806_t:CDS:2 [Funneliformis caledonium]|uniref:2806_t:CDS:1 n=1 Tax=Funneliformis caledonium TaxID=1117310 RepID=A0A9N9HR34_9GLOM|nr:2806_t:CDS:2 [Funneliformis caledonium]
MKSPSFHNPCIQVTNIKVWLYDFEETVDKGLKEYAFNRNQIILWSTTITNSSTARIKSHKTLNRYSFYDITPSFNGVNGSYTLEWNVIPIVGMIKYGRADSNDEKFTCAFPNI